MNSYIAELWMYPKRKTIKRKCEKIMQISIVFQKVGKRSRKQNLHHIPNATLDKVTKHYRIKEESEYNKR